jgi:hypothetical protein
MCASPFRTEQREPHHDRSRDAPCADSNEELEELWKVHTTFFEASEPGEERVEEVASEQPLGGLHAAVLAALAEDDDGADNAEGGDQGESDA